MAEQQQVPTFKLVLVGDPDQLQPIEAGAAFRAIADRIGYAELGLIYRQREAWMRQASTDLAGGQIGAALAAYDDAGMVRTQWSRDEAIASLISDWDRDYRSHPGASPCRCAPAQRARARKTRRTRYRR